MVHAPRPEAHGQMAVSPGGAEWGDANAPVLAFRVTPAALIWAARSGAGRLSEGNCKTAGVDPSLFYTGLVADLYAPLKAASPDPEPYARFIAAAGEPALELGCGDGEPLLDLRKRGLDVEGLDSSADMLERCQRAAAREGVEVVLHHQPMQSMELSRRYRSIFVAGPTFNLLPDDKTARQALSRIHSHLAPGGSALVPLFIPTPTPTEHLGRARQARSSDGAMLSVTALAEQRDEPGRVQTTVLRYERAAPGAAEVLERPWVLHWYTQPEFSGLAASAGLTVTAVLDPGGQPATETAMTFVFMLAASA
jgi:SAM-dependent methyltransferase